MKLSYLFSRIKNMSYDGMFKAVDRVKSKCNKPKWLIFLDMCWCGFRYSAGYMDYDVIGFYKLSSKSRKTMLTRGKNDKIVKKLNDRNYWHIFNNKNEFNDYFKNYLKREYLYPVSKDKEDFFKFIEKHPIFFAKPNDGQCGKGIQKVDINKLDEFFKENDCDKLSGNLYYNLYEYLLENKIELVEEPIKQHKDMIKLNSSSVNTIRIVSVMNDKDEVSIMAIFIRIGNGKIVDNFNSGGMTAKVNKETGEITEDAIDKEGNIYKKHPITNTLIKGFKIPYFEEAKKMVEEAAKTSKNVRYVGWDVAITEDGPCLVEGNQYPGHDIYQVAEKLERNSIGVWPEFKKAME